MALYRVAIVSVVLCLVKSTTMAQYAPRAPEPQPPIQGTLFLHGGGAVDASMRQLFIRWAGGEQARIVVIPTADPLEPLSEKKLSVWQQSESVQVDRLHAQSREEATSPALSDLLAHATGVWFCGGKQTKLIEIYAGTPVEEGIKKLLARGGIVGGTSAGAAIASKKMLVNDEIRHGLDLLPGTIVDQHFLAKNRTDRLQRAVDANPDHVGLGIDEGTAIIVRGREIEVVGRSTVTVYLAASDQRPARVETLKAGTQADLVALRRAAVARSIPPFPSKEAIARPLNKGSLVIAGGGSLTSSMIRTFIQLAGGDASRIVVVPCSEDLVIAQEPDMVKLFRKSGAAHVDWLHTKDRTLADDPMFIAPLAQATGIWFGGGRQWNLVDSYQDTEAHRAMHAVLDRGGVIGGSSAGASIQGDYMPRGDPLGNREIMAEGYERGLGFLCGVAIDQHFAQRDRFADMAKLKRAFPQLLGIGIDEGTAIVVRKNIAEVIGAGNVAFYDRSPDSDEIAEYTSVASGDSYDLVKCQTLR